MFAVQINNLLSPSTKKIGEIIAQPFVVLNNIRTKQDVDATKESFVSICQKLECKNSKKLPYIQFADANMKSIYEILSILRWSYNDNSVKTELLYEILFKLITEPTKEEDELFHAKLLDNLYLKSLDILYLVSKSNKMILENNSEWVLKHNNQEIQVSEFLAPSIATDYGYLYELQNSIICKNNSSLFYNNTNVTEKYKYIENLQEHKLIYNYELEYQDDDCKNLVFIINDKKLITNNPFINKSRYKYLVTNKGNEILQYYNKDVVQKIITDLT